MPHLQTSRLRHSGIPRIQGTKEASGAFATTIMWLGL
jgi:hypothetical protein